MSSDDPPPVPAAVATTLGSPRCAFVTGGPREYWPGISCIAARLAALGTQHPVLAMVPPEDEADAQAVIKHATVVAWRQFPHAYSKSAGWLYRSPHVLDKMNVFGLPLARAVWFDADVYVRRNVDELCDLPLSVKLAATLNLGRTARPTKCWQRQGSGHARCRDPSCMRDFNDSEAREAWVARPASAARPSAALCPYPINSGVMVVSPLGEAAWRERIVRPMRRREVVSYDGGDQGAINTLLYGPAALYGTGLEAHMRLHPRYNVLGRTAKHASEAMGGMPPVLLHFTRETRPWQHPPANGSEWYDGCAASVCAVARGVSSGGRIGRLGALHAEWRTLCSRGT